MKHVILQHRTCLLRNFMVNVSFVCRNFKKGGVLKLLKNFRRYATGPSTSQLISREACSIYCSYPDYGIQRTTRRGVCPKGLVPC